MDYPIKTLTLLKPILQGFRKANGLTQAALAERLGITQQSYAQLEANPASVSVERLFKVLRILDVELVLTGDVPAGPKKSRAEVAAPTPTRVAEKQPTSWHLAEPASDYIAPRPVTDPTKKKERW
ncbi:helix-turn-helix transcriptional regulator [Andreprevotia chitinilytica]|uniref:helix-turn-helix transcriptional regulator n=1 Tax=Andreprevotia chitinilytica TaxID=396808 RepID=UPI0009FFA44B|nr:helix-turn-helix transcriptional regulator [Andreprevotia chitinilytica]